MKEGMKMLWERKFHFSKNPFFRKNLKTPNLSSNTLENRQKNFQLQ